jgi:hypothetical protein
MPVLVFDESESQGNGRGVPRLAILAFRLVARAGRRQLRLMPGMELVSAALLGIGVLLGRDLLQAVVDANRAGSGWRNVLPALVGLTAVSVATTVAGTIARREDQMLSELVQRYAMARILDVTCAAELSRFDDPEFHDLLSRAQRGASRAGQVVHAVFGVAQAITGTSRAIAVSRGGLGVSATMADRTPH